MRLIRHRSPLPGTSSPAAASPLPGKPATMTAGSPLPGKPLMMTAGSPLPGKPAVVTVGSPLPPDYF